MLLFLQPTIGNDMNIVIHIYINTLEEVRTAEGRVVEVDSQLFSIGPTYTTHDTLSARCKGARINAFPPLICQNPLKAEKCTKIQTVLVRLLTLILRYLKN